MSALESPPSLASGWQDPWGTHGTQIDPHQMVVHPVHPSQTTGPHIMTHDYYGKYQMYPQIATMPTTPLPQTDASGEPEYSMHHQLFRSPFWS